MGNQDKQKEYITLIQLDKGAKIVKAHYIDDLSYTGNHRAHVQGYFFKNVLGVELKRDQLIVVENKSSFAVVQVMDPDVDIADMGFPVSKLKHVVGTVNIDALDSIKNSEKSAIKELTRMDVKKKIKEIESDIGENAYNMIESKLKNGKNLDEIEYAEVIEGDDTKNV